MLEVTRKELDLTSSPCWCGSVPRDPLGLTEGFRTRRVAARPGCGTVVDTWPGGDLVAS